MCRPSLETASSPILSAPLSALTGSVMRGDGRIVPSVRMNVMVRGWDALAVVGAAFLPDASGVPWDSIASVLLSTHARPLNEGAAFHRTYVAFEPSVRMRPIAGS